ncbi:hypothetical protein BB560_003126 [Smittium megazygosporum]|uniref:Uncharacterized protein n=1 Tax=Smittium megazygosporum TaxID=133381 RepID=A0A2T9ZCU6_9FUNG|nr:hypothetical protein BB560_003126 [Smittium megazygosporum]
MASGFNNFKKVIIEESGSFDISELSGKEICVLRMPAKFDKAALKNFSFDIEADEPTIIETNSGKYDFLNVSNSNIGLEMEKFSVMLPDEFQTQHYSLDSVSKKRLFVIKESSELPDLTLAGNRAIEETKPIPRKQLPFVIAKNKFFNSSDKFEPRLASPPPEKKVKTDSNKTKTKKT